MRACPACGATYDTSVKICPKDGSVLEAGAEAPDDRIGQTLDGKYRLDAKLGQGGMGAIYRATHLMLDKPVAVKLIKPELVTSPDLVRRFQREARAAGNLNHPNIAAAYDLGQTPDGTLYIAMELVNGPSLKDVIRATGPIDVDRSVRIMRQVGSALALAHRHNIIHRDLKPHNIMLATDGHHEVAKLLDFGIAKTFDEAATQLTQTGFVLGTPQYMSPEQAAGRPIDGRSDLYSLGIILYEMLVGEVPFNDPSTPAVLVKHLTEQPAPPSLRRPDVNVSPVLEAIALRCLAKDPADRFQSADEFLSALPAETGTATAVVAGLDPTMVLAPRGGAPTGFATTQPPMAAMPAGEATVVTPPPQMPPAKMAAPAATLAATLPPAAPRPSATPAAPAAAVVPPPAATPPAPPSSATAQPVAAASSASSSSGSRPLRDILLLAALLLLLVGGAAFGAMRMGLFGGSGATEVTDVAELAPQVEPDAAPLVADPAAPMTDRVPVDDPPAPAPAATTAASQTSSTPAPVSPRVASPPPATTRAPAATPPPTATAAPAVAAPPANPTVFFQCSGAAPVCSSLRAAMTDAFSRHSLRPVGNQGTADVVVTAEVSVVDESSEQLFGSTFVTRTYSVAFEGQARSGDLVPMPGSGTISFDAAVGQERLREQSRVMSMAAADRVRAFWRAQTAGN